MIRKQCLQMKSKSNQVFFSYNQVHFTLCVCQMRKVKFTKVPKEHFLCICILLEYFHFRELNTFTPLTFKGNIIHWQILD